MSIESASSIEIDLRSHRHASRVIAVAYAPAFLMALMLPSPWWLPALVLSALGVTLSLRNRRSDHWTKLWIQRSGDWFVHGVDHRPLRVVPMAWRIMVNPLVTCGHRSSGHAVGLLELQLDGERLKLCLHRADHPDQWRGLCSTLLMVLPERHATARLGPQSQPEGSPGAQPTNQPAHPTATMPSGHRARRGSVV